MTNSPIVYDDDPTASHNRHMGRQLTVRTHSGEFWSFLGVSSPHRTLQPPQDRVSSRIPPIGWMGGVRRLRRATTRYIHYTIEWKLTLNSKKVGSVTEKDLVVAPSDY
jgi:hypothetical protein